MKARALVSALALLTLAAGSLVTPSLRAQESSTLDLQTRFFRTWAGDGVTVVDGLANVPLSMLAASVGSAYRFEVAVEDEGGAELYRDSWERSVSDRAGELTGSGGTLLETFRFGVMPGRYQVILRVYPPDAPTAGVKTELSLEGYGEAPVASDLFVAIDVQPIDETSGGTRWPVTHAGLGIGTAPETVILADRPELHYFLELYSPPEAEESWTGEITAEILASDGRAVFSTSPQTVQVEGAVRGLSGHLSVEGLPSGDYVLAMHVQRDEETEVRQASFRMIDQIELERRMARGPEGGPLMDTFADLSDAELASTFGGVVVFLTEAGRQQYQALPPDAQRRFLADFFARNDTDPTTEANEFLDDYMRRIGQVRMRYEEPVGVEEGKPWLTPRGRIYLRYGEPTDRVEERFPGADMGAVTVRGRPQPPYEIWFYGKTTGFVYLFVDESGFGNYTLAYTSDPAIPSLADWQRRVGGRAIDELRTRFGINPRLSSDPGQ